MKQIILTGLMSCVLGFAVSAQPKKQKQPSQADMNKMMEEAMKAEGMSKEEQEEMKKMMKDVMPALEQHNATMADYPEFADNKELVPAKSIAVAKKTLTKAEVSAYASGLYAKLMTKADPTEAALIKKVIAQTPKATDISHAAVLAMLQGHPQTALGLAIKAVMTEPANLNWQNNMAALLTQYGYAEQAMPLLQKLKNDLANNSTVLNNLANAWLNIGQRDSALAYAIAAIKVNAAHPEAAQVAGVVKESKDHDPVENYTAAMENAPNPFTQSIIKNNGSTIKLTWDNIKKNLTIFEYFTMDWLKIPKLGNSVKGFENDLAIKKAYEEVKDKIEEKITLMTEQAERELDALSDKGDDAFASEMMKSSMEGLSWMSKPAANVLEVLQAFQTQNQLSFADTLLKIENWKNELKKEKDAKIKAIYAKINNKNKTTCEQYKSQLDLLENEYLETVNTRIQKVMVRHIQDYRQWLNAWITWSWYVAGNVKNAMLLQDLQATAHLAGLYYQAVQLQEALPEHCAVVTNKTTHNLPIPEIPNFTCPAVVAIPSGSEWQQLGNSAKDFNKNIYKISKTDQPVPNVSVAYGIGGQVAQPGPSPFVKTANGSVLPAAINAHETEELHGYPTESSHQMPVLEDLAPLPDLARSIVAKKLLTEMLSGDCKKVKTDKQNFKEAMDEIDFWYKIKADIRRMRAQREAAQQAADAAAEQKEVDAIKTEVQQSGLQPTISSGLQSPGTFATQKNLFK